MVLPITDPYTVHHGALGSFAFVYADDDIDLAPVAAELTRIGGIDQVLDHATAREQFELPGDRIGDLAVVGGRDVALGTSP